MDISVIIVSWNAKVFLRECLQALKVNSKYCNIEIIVVDNNSTDGSPEMIAREFPGVKLVQNPTNVGFAKANNIGIRKAVGRYLCLVNSDVCVYPGCLDRLFGFMESHLDVGIAGPKVYNADGTVQYSCRRFPSLKGNICSALGLHRLFPKWSIFANEQMSDFGYDRIKIVDALSGCFLMVRRRALEEVGLLDERFFMYSEDIDWCKRFHEKGWKVIFYPGSAIIHYGGGSSKNAPAKFAVERDLAQLTYWKKHHGTHTLKLLKESIVLRYVVRIVFTLVQGVISRKSRDAIQAKLPSLLWCLERALDFERYVKP